MDEHLTSHASYRIPGRAAAPVRCANPTEIRDRIHGFHTDSTQNDRSGPHTLRHPGQPTDTHKYEENRTVGRVPSLFRHSGLSEQQTSSAAFGFERRGELREQGILTAQRKPA
jgi:hypothetical protein